MSWLGACLSWFVLQEHFSWFRCSVGSAELEALPGSLGLLWRFFLQTLRARHGHWRAEEPLLLPLTCCRYEVGSLRRYCSAVGYGWDHPDSTFRDLPLLYPRFLCSRLVGLITGLPSFRLSPRGLACVRESVRLLQPLDELKRAPFSLEVGVERYRSVCGGEEVDLSLKLRTVRQEEAGWSSTLTLLSPNTTHTHTPHLDTHPADDGVCVRCVCVSVPWWVCVRCVCPVVSLVLPSCLQGYGCSPALWAISRCLVEIEKVKGADAVKPPLTLSVWYTHPLCLPKTVNIRISQSSAHSSSNPAHSFSLEDPDTRARLVSGVVERA